MSLKQKKIQFKPRIKLTHNTYTAGWLTGHGANYMVARFCGHEAPWLVAKQQLKYAASGLLDYMPTWLRAYRQRSSTARWLRAYAATCLWSQQRFAFTALLGSAMLTRASECGDNNRIGIFLLHSPIIACVADGIKPRLVTSTKQRRGLFPFGKRSLPPLVTKPLVMWM